MNQFLLWAYRSANEICSDVVEVNSKKQDRREKAVEKSILCSGREVALSEMGDVLGRQVFSSSTVTNLYDINNRCLGKVVPILFEDNVVLLMVVNVKTIVQLVLNSIKRLLWSSYRTTKILTSFEELLFLNAISFLNSSGGRRDYIPVQVF